MGKRLKAFEDLEKFGKKKKKRERWMVAGRKMGLWVRKKGKSVVVEGELGYNG